jgi:uncharacterized protein YdiU (UPF0061 family)
VLTRIAASHLRVGTFEWAAAHRDRAALGALVDYTIRRHDPAVADAPVPALALFDAIAERQAALIARWQLVGFIHGVMNTDNMAIAGETIDYGPCAFMDVYDPDTVFSSIDHQGRYAYANQPPIAQWNLARLAEALLPMFADDQAVALEHANAALERFTTRFRHHWLAGMRGKLGLATEEDDDVALAEALLAWMHETRADFTNTFRALSAPDGPSVALLGEPGFATWHAQWQARLAREGAVPEARAARMQRHNPAIIPRNHKVEAALTAAADHGDLAPLERLLAALATPFDHARVPAEFAEPADSGARPYRTFCGT